MVLLVLAVCFSLGFGVIGCAERPSTPPSGEEPVAPSGGEPTLPTETTVNGKIAFRYDENLHVINPDGTNEIRLAEAWVYEFCWSPDGKKIAYVLYEGCEGGFGEVTKDLYSIYTVNSDGTGKTQIVSPDDIGFAVTTSLSWSPDGKKILFVADRGEWINELKEYSNGVYVVNADGSNLIKVNKWPAVIDVPPSAIFSPDGKKIAYTAENGEIYQVYITNSDGTGNTKLIVDKLWFLWGALTWSPDGKKISYLSGALYMMDIDSTNKILLADSSVASPSVWLPDGKILFYCDGLYTINPDGTGKSRFLEGTEVSCIPSWSPDGKKIVFTEGDTICIANADGSNVTEIAYGYDPQWSPK